MNKCNYLVNYVRWDRYVYDMLSGIIVGILNKQLYILICRVKFNEAILYAK